MMERIFAMLFAYYWAEHLGGRRKSLFLFNSDDINTLASNEVISVEIKIKDTTQGE